MFLGFLKSGPRPVPGRSAWSGTNGLERYRASLVVTRCTPGRRPVRGKHSSRRALQATEGGPRGRCRSAGVGVYFGPVATNISRRRRWRQAVLPSVVRPPFSVVQLPRSAGGGLVEDQRCSHETPPHWRGAQNFSKKVLHGSGSLLFCQPAFPKLGGGDLTTINRQLLFVWLNVLEFASRPTTFGS